MDRFLSDRAQSVKESGIRRIFNLAATLKDPINFSIGQPDFDVPRPIKHAAIQAMQEGHNGYTVTQGLPALREEILQRLQPYYQEDPSVVVTCGVSGGLHLALMATVNPGDEVVFADPYFVSYPNLVTWLDGQAVQVSTYPDFKLTAARVEKALTPKSKILLINSPNNPTGLVYTDQEMKDLCELADKHDLLILSDEIYADLSYDGKAATPLSYAPERTVLLRGFGKSYGMTGWRMGYVAGPPAIISQIGNFQQYTYVCAPSMAQHGAIVALNTDMSQYIDSYRRKRDLVVSALKEHYHFEMPTGGFYCFLEVPKRYDNSMAFVESALERNLLSVPGSVFSQRDTHLRISYAVDDACIQQGCEILQSMA